MRPEKTRVSIVYAAEVAFKRTQYRAVLNYYWDPLSQNAKRLEDSRGSGGASRKGVLVLRKVMVQQARGTKAGENVSLGR